MQGFQSQFRWRRAFVLFLGWSFVGLVFSGVSLGAAIIESRRFTLSDALRLNLVNFYLWGIFSVLIFWFGRRFTIEFWPLKLGNLLLHIPLLFSRAGAHQVLHLAIFWSLTHV